MRRIQTAQQSHSLLTHTSSNQLSKFFLLSQASLMIFCDAGCGTLPPCIATSVFILRSESSHSRSPRSISPRRTPPTYVVCRPKRERAVAQSRLLPSLSLSRRRRHKVLDNHRGRPLRHHRPLARRLLIGSLRTLSASRRGFFLLSQARALLNARAVYPNR